MSTDTPTVETVTVKPDEPVAISRRDATVMELAAVIASSRDFPDCRTPEKAAVRILAGKEMGVGPIASIIGIRVNAGRVSMDATLMAGCIKRSGRYDYKVTSHNNEVCTLVFFENGEPVGESGFSMADAKQASLAGKETWRNYPRNMLFARALSNGARWYCPAIFGGAVYTHEELGYSVDAEGRAIESESGSSNGNDLCTRDQRQQIRSMIESLGDTEADYLANLGIKMLDELSQREAAKEIKKLEKRLAKAGAPTGKDAKLPDASQTDTAESAAPAEQPLSPAQTMIAEAFDEGRQPSTDQQRETILTLAEQLEPDEALCREMLVAALAKRSCRKLADLTHLQAASLIETIQAKVTERNQPPFEPTPATGK